MINIGWVIDNKYRELKRLYSFKKKLKKKKINLIFFNKLNFKLGIKSYDLSALIIPNMWDFGLKIADTARSLGVPKVYVYHTECFEESENYLKVKYPLNDLKKIDLIFCHTKNECEFLERNNFKNYEFVGHYKYFGFKEVLNKKNKKTKRNVIGITSTNKYLANPHTDSLIYVINRRYNDEFIRDYLKYEIDYIFFLTRLKKFCEKNNYKILFRPHPMEQNDKYNFLINNHFQVDYSNTIDEFLDKIDILLNHISSSSYDAVLSNIPVINHSNFFEKLENFNELYQFPPANIGKKIEKFDEIKNLFENNKNLEKLIEANIFIKNDILEKIFYKNQDPLKIIENIFLKEKKNKKKIKNFVFLLIFFIKQMITNFKKNRYEAFNLYNFKDNNLLKKMDEKN